MGAWSELPQELLHLIALRIDNCFDLVHFRSVCSSWRSSAPPRLRRVSFPSPLPLDEDGFGDDCHILRRRICLLRSRQRNRPLFWLFKLGEDVDGAPVVLNLFHNSFVGRCEPPYLSVLADSLDCQAITLGYEEMASHTVWFPGFGDGGYEFIVEEDVAFMWLGAEKDDFAVLRGGTLFRSIDKRWTVLEDVPKSSEIEADASFKGKFYIVDCSGTTTVITPSLEVSSFQHSWPTTARPRKTWLVRLGHHLCLVKLFANKNESDIDDRYVQYLRERKTWFEAFKLNEERNDWDQVEDLSGRVVFLAHRSSFSCLACDVPAIRENSIFFMDIGISDILVYDFADRSLNSLKDIPEYYELFHWPFGWLISNE